MNLGSETLFVGGDIRLRSWPNTDGTYGTRYSQILIIAQTSKALYLLLKQSPRGIIVFYGQKTPKRGRAFMRSRNGFP